MPQPARRSLARKNQGQKTLGVVEAKEHVLGLIAQGMKVDDAMASVGRSGETYRDWRKNDEAFRLEVTRLREARSGDADDQRVTVPDFPEFCEELGWPMAPHHRHMWDVMNGREPTDMPASFRLQWGVKWESDVEAVPGGRYVLNAPPGFSKTTTMSIALSAWLIHKNPDIRIIVVCRDQGLAKQILGSVKRILTSPMYREMQARYAPEGGWKDPDASWTSTEIFVQGRGSGEKDPTMQALGIGGRIYGARADVIILDDAVTGTNVNEYAKQERWIAQEVESRLDGRGLLAVYGTRLAPIDLYSTLRDVTVMADDDEDPDAMGEVPRWTYFAMPAVVDYGTGHWKQWVSLWPERFPPKRLRLSRTNNEAIWALTFQQLDVSENAVFNARAIEAAVNPQRRAGPMTKEGMGHRPGGMDGLWIVGGVDPAADGFTAMVICGLDKTTGKRYILDGFNNRATSVELLKSTMRRFTESYRVNEWIIESNAAQKFLLQDAQLRAFMQGHSCRMLPHNTNKEKHDPDFGVMSMAPLFDSCGQPPSNNGGGKWERTPETALIELPSTALTAWTNELVQQLVTWQPHTPQGQKTDLVMAMWFTHIACQKLMGRGQNRPTHMNNPFLSRERSRSRQVINIADYRAALEAEKEAG